MGEKKNLAITASLREIHCGQPAEWTDGILIVPLSLVYGRCSLPCTALCAPKVTSSCLRESSASHHDAWLRASEFL